MSKDQDEYDDYFDIRYQQFSKSSTFIFCERFFGILTWPIVWPLAMISKVSEIIFRTISEAFSLIPYVFGVIVRYEFYKFALRNVGRNVQIEFGTIFIHPNISIGSDVLIGRYSIIHHCDIGDYVLIGERCTFLGGSKQHNHERVDVPMALQGGKKKRIELGNDCWIGSHALVMECVESGSIVAAASVVTKPVGAYSIVAGSPARVVGTRNQ